MTSEPRRAPPKTLDDLVDRKYDVATLAYNDIIMSAKDSKGRKLQIYNTTIANYYKIFNTQSQNVSAKLSLCVDEFFINYLANETRKNYNWHQLEDVLYTSHEAFVFNQLAFYFRMFKHIVDKLIETGIMNHLTENFYTKGLKFEKIQSLPKVLRVEDLAFGFNIWLGFCCFSILSFVGELMSGKLKNVEKIINSTKRDKFLEENGQTESNDVNSDAIQGQIDSDESLDDVIDEILAIEMD